MSFGLYDLTQKLFNSDLTKGANNPGAQADPLAGALSFKDHLSVPSSTASTSVPQLGSHLTSTFTQLREAEHLATRSAAGDTTLDPTQVDTAVVQAALRLEETTKALSGFVNSWNDLTKTGI